MALGTNVLELLINAKDNASGVIQQVATNANAASAEMAATTKGLAKVADSLTSIGSTLTKTVTLPMAALAGISGKMAYDFQQQMELLHTSAGIPQDALQGLSDKVLAMAGQTAQAPEDLAKGLYHVASAGQGIWNTSQMLDVLHTAAEGAKLGMASLDDTTYSLSSALASGIKGASDPTSMMGVLNAIVGAGDMKMNDLNGALSTGILSTAAQSGTSIQSVGAALATLTDNGEHADEAATRLRMTMALMESPSSMAAKQLEALGLTAENAKSATSDMNEVFKKSGLTTTKLADDLRQPNGIAVAVEDLKKHLEDAGLSASEADAMLAKAFGGGRSDAALMTMLQNTGRMDSKFKDINANAGDMQQKFSDLNNTPMFKIQSAWASMQADLVKIGGDLLPLVAKAIGVVSKYVDEFTGWWSKLDDKSKHTIEAIAIGIGVGGPIFIGLGKTMKALGDFHDGWKVLQDAAKPVMKVIGDGMDALANQNIPGVSKAVQFLRDLTARQMIMGGIAIAGALYDIDQVMKAVQAVQGAIAAMNQAASAAAQSNAAGADLRKVADQELAAGKITKQRHDQLYQIANQGGQPPSFWDYAGAAAGAVGQSLTHWALGTNYAHGGLAMVGENGPELVRLPKGSQVFSTNESNRMLSGNGATININGGITIANQMDEQKFLKDIAWRLAIS